MKSGKTDRTISHPSSIAVSELDFGQIAPELQYKRGSVLPKSFFKSILSTTNDAESQKGGVEAHRRMIKDGAALHFPDKNRSSKKKSESIRIIDKISTWYHDNIVQDQYTEDTPEKRMTAYFAKRQLPKYTAKWWELAGLGISAVISGEFSGWNVGIQIAGLHGFWISSVLATLMYLSLALCLGEMSAAIPSTRIYGFSRAVFGDWAGFLVGTAENLEYITFSALVLRIFSDSMTEASGGTFHEYPIIWWLIILIPVILITCRFNVFLWKLFFWGSVVIGIQIIGFSIFAGLYFDASVWSANSYMEKDTNSTMTFPFFKDGFMGVVMASDCAAWWFTGLECVALATKESLTPVSSVPRGLLGSWLYLFVCAILFCIFNTLVPPGWLNIKDVVFPTVAIMTEILGPWGKFAGLLLTLPSTFMNLLGCFWCASRQTWSLSRVGYIPKFLSITSSVQQTPVRAILLNAACALIIAALVSVIDSGAQTSGAETLLFTTLVSSFVSYIGIAATYIGFRRSFPNVPRPFKNPLGMFSAIFTIILCSLTLIFKAIQVDNIEFRYAIVSYIICTVIAALYFAVIGRSALLPTEESLLRSTWDSK